MTTGTTIINERMWCKTLSDCVIKSSKLTIGQTVYDNIIYCEKCTIYHNILNQTCESACIWYQLHKELTSKC
jgi:hypothetical protein